MSVMLRMKVTSYPRREQPAPQHVEVDRRADVAHVRLRLHRQPAHVDARLALLEGDEVADRARSGVVEPEGHRGNRRSSERSEVEEVPPGTSEPR